MPVIAFASPKGGAGKTTSSLILATSLVAHTQDPNFRVIIIDGDNNHPHIDWAKANASTLNRPRNLEIMAAPSEATIMDEIKAAKGRANFVLVDLEGAATALLTYAITLADFVVVPLQGSKLDGTQARKIVKLMENQGEMRGKPIPHAVLFTRTNPAIKPGNLKHVIEEVQRNGIDHFAVHLHEREPFRDIFSFDMTLQQLFEAFRSEAATAEAEKNKTERRQALGKIESIEKAIENADAFTRELVSKLEASTLKEKELVA